MTDKDTRDNPDDVEVIGAGKVGPEGSGTLQRHVWANGREGRREGSRQEQERKVGGGVESDACLLFHCLGLASLAHWQPIGHLLVCDLHDFGK